jgi:hypothetical protein
MQVNIAFGDLLFFLIQFKCNVGKYPARLPDTWEPYSLATGRIIAITCTWNNINLFDHDIEGQVHSVDIPLFDTLVILDLQTKKFAHRIHVLPWTIKTLTVLTMVFTFALE